MFSKNWLVAFSLVDYVKRTRSFFRRAQFRLGVPKQDGYASSVPQTIPRKIWIFWAQGIEAAPPIVQMCVASWQEKNPDWEVVVIDRQSVGDYVDMPDLAQDIPIQAYADLLRVRLLNQVGGVWVDATGYCVRPLSQWLPFVAQSGFFAFFWTPDTYWFQWPSYTREVANWFLAATPGSQVIKDWEAYSFDYWKGRESTSLYFWPHTLFETLTYIRAPFRKALKRVPVISCMGPHLVHDCIFRERDVEETARLIADGTAPVQKLRWQWDEEKQGIVKRALGIES